MKLLPALMLCSLLSFACEGGHGATPDMQSHNFNTMADALVHHDDVVFLNIIRSEYRRLPPEVRYFKNIEYMQFSHGYLDYIDSTISTMPKLYSIDINSNMIDSISGTIGRVTTLV